MLTPLIIFVGIACVMGCDDAVVEGTEGGAQVEDVGCIE